jgi:hypothetical protein
MGLSFYGLASLPQQYDVVWCLYPRRQDRLAPGPIARPTLVLDVQVQPEQKIARLLVAYGTGEFDEGTHGKIDLIIDDRPEVRALGLLKATRFALSLQSRMLLPWCVEYFVAPSYLAQCGIIAGSLTVEQIDRLTQCLAARGLKPFRCGE